MTKKELEVLAKTFLLDVSNDESWIDGSSTFVKKKLVALLEQVSSASNNSDPVADHAALGAWVGAFDE
jgi:hypothetical protein